MIKDAAAKLLLIPLLGFGIAIFTSLASFSSRPFSELILSGLFWIVVTYFLWQGIVAITAFIRKQAQTRRVIALKIFLLLVSTAATAWVVTSFAVSLWQKLFQTPMVQTNTGSGAFAYLAIAPIIGLVYEILFLKKEQELDSKIVAQLDHERQSAELQALASELEPHFIFNALNVLSPLITTDAAKAQVFTIKLSQAYKYLLLNKDRELITLQEEIHFIQDYFFLLQIRHENKVRLEMDLHGMPTNTIMILPFALQVLVENAIKHNQFSEENPLVICIAVNKQFIQLSNTFHPKSYIVQSTNVGLKNLSARYKLICNKDIIIYQTENTFLVKLPLIKTAI
jgi:two-component system, LytTR family, sensor kinase